MVIYIYGKDTKRSREHVAKLITKFTAERDPEGMNVKRLCAGECDDSLIRAELMTAPFLSEKRMVVVERMIERGGAELLRWFDMRFLCAESPAHVIVALWEEEPVKKAATDEAAVLHAKLIGGKFSAEFGALTGKKRGQYVVRLVSDRGGSITTDAADMLVRRVEDDYSLANVIAQLCSYAVGRPISRQDLDIFLPPDVENNIFDAMDQLSIGNRVAAMKLLTRVWQADNDPVYIFAMLHRQVRLLSLTRDLIADNAEISADQIAKTLGIHPFVAKKLFAQAKRWSTQQLSEWYDRLVEIDFTIKHGSTDPHVLIDSFVAAG